MGCAKDIVEYCGVSRFLFSDFPLGNSAGRPFDVESQASTLELALRVLESAPAARTTVQSPLRWREDAAWKLDFSNLDRMTPEQIAERRREFDEIKAIAKTKRDRGIVPGGPPPGRAKQVSKPFAGVRILDFTRYLAGPYGTYQLALLGADVVKIESHEGDESRHLLVSKQWADRKMASSFLAVNANKRSITLDLRKPAAVEVVKRLATRADVVWENFRPGVMDRLGLGYKTLAAINPRLIYCAVSGFGHTGPERTTAAFDGKLQAMSGIMSITGEPAGGPMRAGFAICDTIGGMTAALAVSSALYQRTHTGRGQFVDVAMLDAALAFIPGPVSEYTVAGIEQRQIGNG